MNDETKMVNQMKYIGYWELNLKDWDQAWKKQGEVAKDVNENPEKYPKFILGPHIIGESNKGISIFETDEPNKLLNLSTPYIPFVKWKFVPLYSLYECQTIYEEWNKK